VHGPLSLVCTSRCVPVHVCDHFQGVYFSPNRRRSIIFWGGTKYLSLGTDVWFLAPKSPKSYFYGERGRGGVGLGTSGKFQHQCRGKIFRPPLATLCLVAILKVEVTPVAGSIFGPLAQTHFSKRVFKNGHISRFCFVFQVILVILSVNFCSAEEVNLSFNAETKEHPKISKPSFWKRDCENVFVQMFKFREKWIHSTNTK